MELDIDKLVSGYISESDWKVKENSNSGYSFAGLQGFISNTALTKWGLENLYTGEVSQAHEDGIYHIHDLSHPLVGYCFTGDTKIKLIGGSVKSLKELSDSGCNDFLVYSKDSEGNTVIGHAHNPRITRKNAELVRVVLDNYEEIRCTPDHPFMLLDGSYKRADELTHGYLLTTYNNGYRDFYDRIVPESRKVLFVEHLNYTEDVYDITVDNHHNFLLDAGVYVHNCSGWSLENIIKEGFNCGSKFIYSTPANHLDALYGQLNNFIFTMTGEWAGAQALNSMDTFSAAFIKKDKLTDTQLKRILRTFIYNLNVKTRIAMQAPFTNWSIDLTVPDDLKYKKAIIGGKEEDFTYGDCQEEMNQFNKILAEVMMQGDGMHKIFTFPIITYSITKEFPWDSELAKDIFTFADEANSPYFSNFINSDQEQSSVRSMCCRLRLNLRELVKASSGLFGFGDNTGSIGVVTLNLSKIAYMSKVLVTYSPDDHDYINTEAILSHYPELKSMVRIQLAFIQDHNDAFIEQIYLMMIRYFCDLAYKSLMIKRDKIQDTLDRGLIPYTKKYLGNFSNHFNTIGVNAGHEACLNALGVGIDDPKGKKFMIDTLNLILNLEKDYQEKNNGKLLFNLEATPAEGASTRFAKKDKVDFDHIITGAGTQGDFYTNSTQLPDNYSDNIFDIFEHQNDLQPLYTSGTVQHIYMNEPTHNWRVIQSLVKKLFTNYKLPYLSISPDICVCPIHGRLPHYYKYCPYEHTEDQVKMLIDQGILPRDDKE